MPVPVPAVVPLPVREDVDTVKPLVGSLDVLVAGAEAAVRVCDSDVPDLAASGFCVRVEEREESDLEARVDLALTEEEVLVTLAEDGLTAPAPTGLVLVVEVDGAFSFFVAAVVVVELLTAAEEVASTEMETVTSATAFVLVLAALPPSVVSVDDLEETGLTLPPSLLTTGCFPAGFVPPVARLLVVAVTLRAGLSFADFCDVSNSFFSSKALFLSATASAFSLSFTRLSSSLFFLSASCCCLTSADLSALMEALAPLGFLAGFASLVAAGLLGSCLVVESGFLDSGVKESVFTNLP